MIRFGSCAAVAPSGAAITALFELAKGERERRGAGSRVGFSLSSFLALRGRGTRALMQEGGGELGVGCACGERAREKGNSVTVAGNKSATPSRREWRTLPHRAIGPSPPSRLAPPQSGLLPPPRPPYSLTNAPWGPSDQQHTRQPASKSTLVLKRTRERKRGSTKTIAEFTRKKKALAPPC